ncbi:MAG: M23 family metallopeptidase [Acidobacteria bacterium]|nr:M23 family metallopeptidase [Acidobacteriota bacterium]
MRFLAFLLFAMLVGMPVGDSSAQSAVLWMSVEPAQPVNGSPVLFRVWVDKPLKSLSGIWLGHRVTFEFDSASRAWCGLAGVELGTAAGSHPLRLELISTNDTRSTSIQTVTTGQGSYASSILTVDDKFMSPNADEQVRIRQERALKRDVFRRGSRQQLWKGGFAAPVDNIVTEAFGVRRIFNGRQRSRHQGLDFRAALGTPVKAMNSGEVILARQMFYEGGLVVIDHGHGLLTMYLHLSDFKTTEGSRVSKGQIIGLSGATGRVTSEHLHVGVRWQGTYLDPAILLTMKLP